MMQNGQYQKSVSPTVYSGYTLSNAGNEVSEKEQSRISFSYWNSCLKITVQPRKESSYGKDIAEFNTDSTACIYLRCFKANVLANEISKFIHDPSYKKLSNCGIGSGGSVLIVSREKDDVYKITIINNSTSTKASYICHKTFFEHIKDFNFENGSFKEVSDGYELKDLEIFIDQLFAFYSAMTNAIAYSVIDREHYTMNRLSENIESIGMKLGVDMKTSNYGGYKKKASYKDMNSSTSFNKETMDNLNAELESME